MTDKSTLSWIPLEHGRVTAAGAPGRGRLVQWADQGATDVITLQRSDEHKDWLPAACAEAGLGWHHLPLSGRRLQRTTDQDSLARISSLLDVFRVTPPRSAVVHCSAGLHRTGVCLYLLLRHAGHGRDEAIALIARARPLTAEELVRRTRRHGALVELAEQRLQSMHSS